MKFRSARANVVPLICGALEKILGDEIAMSLVRVHKTKTIKANSVP